MRRVWKYGTGHPIPDGARHVATVTQNEIFVEAAEIIFINDDGTSVSKVEPGHFQPCWLVWHYYEVDA